jgi:hypothetical protein
VPEAPAEGLCSFDRMSPHEFFFIVLEVPAKGHCSFDEYQGVHEVPAKGRCSFDATHEAYVALTLNSKCLRRGFVPST